MKCKYVKREGESCTLNNNCRYPNCPSEDKKPPKKTKGTSKAK